MSKAFDDLVLAWLTTKYPDAVEVVKVNGDGTDWEGDTEGGFYSRFGVEITYVRGDGTTGFFSVAGDDMEELWNHVVNSLP